MLKKCAHNFVIRYFKDYPQIKEVLKDLSMKEFRKDPTILVKKLDEVLK